MVLWKNDFALKVQLFLQLRLHPYFVFDPKRNRFQKRMNAARRVGKIRMQNAVELYEWLLIKSDVIEFRGCDAALAQAIVDGIAWKSRVVLLSREAFLLSRRDDYTIPHQARRTVMVISGDAEDMGAVPCHWIQPGGTISIQLWECEVELRERMVPRAQLSRVIAL